nr:hypothetical protein [Tanacetum cinerariifolium]
MNDRLLMIYVTLLRVWIIFGNLLIASGADLLSRADYDQENKEVQSGMYFCDVVAIMVSFPLSSLAWSFLKVRAISCDNAYPIRKVPSYVVVMPINVSTHMSEDEKNDEIDYKRLQPS